MDIIEFTNKVSQIRRWNLLYDIVIDQSNQYFFDTHIFNLLITWQFETFLLLLFLLFALLFTFLFLLLCTRKRSHVFKFHFYHFINIAFKLVFNRRHDILLCLLFVVLLLLILSFIFLIPLYFPFIIEIIEFGDYLTCTEFYDFFRIIFIITFILFGFGYFLSFFVNFFLLFGSFFFISCFLSQSFLGII
mgnify:CR=1 FL=1